MKTSTLRNATLSALLAAMLVSACGGDDPAALLKSAREYLAKNDAKAAIIQVKNVLQKQPGNAEARFLLGKALLDAGDATAAEVELRKAMEQRYSQEDTVPLMVKALLMKGQAKRAVQEFGKTDLTTPVGQAELQTLLSVAYRMLGDSESAYAALNAALKAKPNHAPALVLEARMKAGEKDLAGALAMIDNIVQKDPANAEAYKLKGDILLAQEKPDEAAAAYRKGLEGQADHLPSHATLITLLMQQGKVDEAGKQLAELRKHAPKHPQTLLLESQLAFQKKEYKAARESLQQFHKIARPNALSLQLAGAVEYQLGSYGMAEENLAKALQENSNLPAARRLLISTYLRVGQPAKALDTLKPVLDKVESDASMLALAGEVFIQQGDYKRAEEYYAKATKLDPKDATKRTRLAITHLAKGDAASAFDELQEISASDSGVAADYALISAHLRRNEIDKALKALDVLEKKRPDDPVVYNMRGQTLMAKQDKAGARQNFEKALALKPAFFPAAASLASMDLADKKPEDAKRRYESVLAADPKNLQAYLGLAGLASRSGAKTEEVAALVNKAVAISPTNVGARLALIETYLRGGEAKKAVTAAQEAMTAVPDRVELVDAAGRAQLAAGDHNQALAMFNKMSNMQPRSPVPYLKMAEVNVLAKNKEEAIRNLKKSLDQKPDFVDSQQALTALYVNVGRFKEAQGVAKEVQRQRPKSPLGFAMEGDVAIAQKSWGDAAKAYRAGLEREPVGELAMRLHSALYAGGNRGEAEKLVVTWLKDHPKDLAFRNFVAERASERQDWPAAAQQYRAILEAQPDSALVLNNLAWIADKLKDPKAVDYAEKAVKLAPNQPAFMDTLAMLLAEKGDVARARELAAKAVELAPKQASFRLNLARVLIKAGNKTEAKVHLDTLAKLGANFPEQAEVAKLLKEL